MNAWLPILAGAVAGVATVSYSDAFTRTENPLSDGGAWTNGGTGFGNMLTGVTVARPVSGTGVARVTTPSFASYPNQSATITIASTSGVGCFVRMDGGGNGYRLYAVSSTSLRISTVTASVGSAIGADFAVTALTAGTTITLEVVGTTLNAYRNGVFITSRSDGTYSTGAPGIYGDSNSNTIEAFACTSV
jgi:hypothetical protein